MACAGGRYAESSARIAAGVLALNVLLVASADIPSFHINVRKPLEVLQANGAVDLRIRLSGAVSDDDIWWADCLVFCRCQEAIDLRVMEAAAQRRKMTIYDIDDNFVRIPLSVREGRFHRDPVRLHVLRQMVSRASLTRTYSHALCSELSAWSPSVVQRSGTIDASMIAGVHPRASGGLIRVTYASHRVDGPEINDLLARTVDRASAANSSAVQFVFWGKAPRGCASATNVFVIEAEPDYGTFMRRLHGEGFDIGLAPALDTPFFNSKTITKYRDYGLCRIAGVYSDTPLYRNGVIDGETGLLVGNDPSAWAAALRRLIDEPDLRRRLANAAQEDVLRRHNLDRAVELWRADLSLQRCGPP